MNLLHNALPIPPEDPVIKTFLLCISNMSNHKIEIDFNDLKYNLYDLLGLNPDSSIRRVKKRYRKLILEYHPDKTPNFEEDDYNHLTMANQILTNESYRKKYDDFMFLKYFPNDKIYLVILYASIKSLQSYLSSYY